MASAVAADLSQLKLMFAVFERYDKTINSSQIHAELGERLREELDYQREARHNRLYARMLATEKGVHVPEMVDELSTARLLTTTWLDGEPLLDFVDRDADSRGRIAANMFRAWYVPFYKYVIFSRIDLYVAPSFGGDNLLLTNMTGHPALVMPNGFAQDGTPTSISFTGRLYGESELVAVGRAFQQATSFHLRHPPVAAPLSNAGRPLALAAGAGC